MINMRDIHDIYTVPELDNSEFIEKLRFGSVVQFDLDYFPFSNKPLGRTPFVYASKWPNGQMEFVSPSQRENGEKYFLGYLIFPSQLTMTGNAFVPREDCSPAAQFTFEDLPDFSNLKRMVDRAGIPFSKRKLVDFSSD